jgi:hypothetical protein
MAARGKKGEIKNEHSKFHVTENNGDKNLISVKFVPNLECYRKIYYLSARTLNVIEKEWVRRFQVLRIGHQVSGAKCQG